MKILFTSAIFPSVPTAVAAKAPDLRKQQLVEAIRFNINNIKCHHKSISAITILEMLPTNTQHLNEYINIYKPSLIEEISNLGLNVKLFEISPTDCELKEINRRGKGYAEIVLLRRYIYSEKLQDEDKLLKITGRYKITNLNKLLEPIMFNNQELSISYSDFLQNAITHFFVIRVATLRNFIDFAVTDLCDEAGVTLEKKMYRFIKGKRKINKVIYPQPSSDTMAGYSGKVFSSKLKNLIRRVFYEYI